MDLRKVSGLPFPQITQMECTQIVADNSSGPVGAVF